MNDQEKLRLFAEVFALANGKSLPAGVSLETEMSSLSMDSLATLEMVGLLEERLSCRIPDSELMVFTTIGEFMGVFEKYSSSGGWV